MLAFSFTPSSSQEKLNILKQCVLHFWEQKKRLGIVCENEASKNFIQDYFWKYPFNGFLPTATYQKGYFQPEPVLISYENQADFQHTLFLSLHSLQFFPENSCSIFLCKDKEQVEGLQTLNLSSYHPHKEKEAFLEDIYNYF